MFYYGGVQMILALTISICPQAEHHPTKITLYTHLMIFTLLKPI
jgi:hypothetical protein